MFRDLAERRASAADLLLTARFRLDLCMLHAVDETCITLDPGCVSVVLVWLAVLAYNRSFVLKSCLAKDLFALSDHVLP